MANKLRYQARRVDTNQKELVKAARSIGAVVLDTHALGRGAPDLMVMYHGKWTPVEVKRPGERLTAGEIKWWKRVGVDPIIAIDNVSLFRAIGAETFPFDDKLELVNDAYE